MRGGLAGRAILAGLLSGAPALSALPALAGEDPAVAGRVQAVFDPVARTVTRQLVRVVDLAPGLGLDFTWEPAAGNAPGVDAEGFATGPGTLVWRIPGAAAYDPRSVSSRYAGTLKAGAYDGEGVLTDRDGSRRDGLFAAGLQTGTGTWRQPDGTLYEGGFQRGLPEGTGTLRAAAGWIYTGGFRAGAPHGPGHMRLPGGQEYDVVMEMGREVSSTRPAVIADSTLGGLLPAQGGGGDAGKVSISVVTDARVSLEQSISYVHYNDGSALQLYPESSEDEDGALLNLWTGGGEMGTGYIVGEMTRDDWLATRAFLDVTVATDDGSKVRIDSLDLVADESMPHLKPMLEPRGVAGCVGHRPVFDFVNRGWGAVEAPSLRVRFANPASFDLDGDGYTPATDWLEVPVQPFDAGGTVDVTPALAALGVDTATLAGSRFTCPSHEMLGTCTANLLSSVEFGGLEPAVKIIAPDADDAFYVGSVDTMVLGELTYRWTDAWGGVQTQTESFSTPITLAVIEAPAMAAEMGAGGAFATPAPEFQEIELPVEGRDIRVNIPLRGNPNIASVTAHIQLYAQRSSIHTMHVEATFADGSVRSSMPMHLFYLSPREVDYASAFRPGACYLAREY